ncbi:MAG: flagellar brake protein [Burkholderiales bacterium]|nr:flagellar brake protein [Burkholderiales bacterium]
MRLKVGDRAQLEPPPTAGGGRVAVRIVGWIENECLIVNMPPVQRVRLGLLEGETVMLRVFTGQNAFAFRSSVLKKYTPVSEYLQLSFPRRVEGVAVRNSPRYRIDIPARIVLPAGGEPVLAHMDNIGITGALLDAPAPLGERGASLRVTFDLVLHDVPVSLSLAATIRSIQSDETAGATPRHRHGVSFENIAPNDRLILAALVWYHLYENPRRAA